MHYVFVSLFEIVTTYILYYQLQLDWHTKLFLATSLVKDISKEVILQ